MVLQQILLLKDTDGLYSHSRGKIEYKNDNSAIFEKGTLFSTGAYLNAFSVGKWCTYCDLENISLHISLKGAFHVKVMYAYIDRETKLRKRQIAGGHARSFDEKIVIYDIPMKKQGVVWFELKALSDGASCCGAHYEGRAKIEKDITIALNICTYKREESLLGNLCLLRQSFLENKESPLYGHLQVFVTDNGNTLPIDALHDENVHVCHNPNFGGAGGFARGLIEIDKARHQKNITNVIFMDDDVEIIPEGIMRTYAMLRCMKDGYRSAFIAGALLYIDRKYIQHENGAIWNAGGYRSVGRGLDMRRFYNVVFNETEDGMKSGRDCAAWWYCCIPVSVVREDNLPIPIFIHADDAEYSLRNADGIITMNGIAVWHPEANRRVSSNEYYNFRNTLIVNARHCPRFSRKRLIKRVAARLLVTLLRYRYRDMHLVYQALEDFCKSPEWLLKLDAPAYHQKIVEMGYNMTDMSQKVGDCKRGKCSGLPKTEGIKGIVQWAAGQKKPGWLLCRIVTLNGWLLPPEKNTKAYPMGVHPFDLYKADKVILYDEADFTGIEVRRSFCQIFVCAALFLKSLWLIFTKYDDSKTAYQKHWDLLQGIEYWRGVYGK